MERKLSFSERYGYIKVSDVVQYECMSEELRTVIFNSFVEYIIIGFYNYDRGDKLPTCTLKEALYIYKYADNFNKFFKSFYVHVLKKRITDIPESKGLAWKEFEMYFNNAQWHEVYSLVEWFYQKIVTDSAEWQNAFHKRINKDLEEYGAGYRMLNGLIMPITDNNELVEIQSAITVTEATKHLDMALQCLHDKDYRNSVKESISAVEALVRTKTGKSTLGAGLSELEDKQIIIPQGLKQGMYKIYGWTCGEDGIRHAIMENAQEITVAEAKFMLVVCSAFINYLKMKDIA